MRADEMYPCMRLMFYVHSYKLHICPSCIHAHSQIVLVVLWGFFNFPTMQLSSIQLKLLWLSLTVLAMAATPPLGTGTRIGTGQLNLLTPETPNTTSINRAVYCKHDDDPYHFISSLNYTFPDTPAISQSFLTSAGINESEGTYPFDCFLEIPGGIVVFEVC